MEYIYIDYILQYETNSAQHLIHRILMNTIQRFITNYNNENNIKIQSNENKILIVILILFI